MFPDSLATDLSDVTPDYQVTFTYATSGWTDQLTRVKKTYLLGGVPYDAIEAVTYDNIGNVLTCGDKSYGYKDLNLLGFGRLFFTTASLKSLTMR